jgi:hypothetical protein
MKTLVSELKNHVPFTALASSLALIIMLSLHFSYSDFLITQSEVLFHIFHPVHILFSAIVTTAIFYKYKQSAYKSIGIGFIGSVGVCSISDIIIPYLGGVILGTEISFHFCLIEHPLFVLIASFTGISLGLIIKKTIFSHSMHVLISTMASLLYLIKYGFVWYQAILQTFIIVFIAVIVPCCTSDVIFPVLASKKKTI